MPARVRRHFTEHDPTFWVALSPALIVAALLFVRSPASNYIFDEQEALLANPYVNGVDLGFWDVLRRDFWGLPPTRSIGSYRPLPNLIWRALWNVSKLPWLHHWVNVALHAVNAALLAGFVLGVTRRRDMAWLAGGVFLCSAVLTEAITGVVGIADVLGGLGVILALRALRLPLWAMPLGVCGAMLVGLFSKESVIVGVPLVFAAAVALSPALHPERPLTALRAPLALLATVSALVAYTYTRRHFFPVDLPPSMTEPLPDGTSWPRRAMQAFLVWFAQPRLPADPMNNPLAAADTPYRIAGALRVYASGLLQVIFPWRLSGDYSFPQEPAPARLLFPGSVLGGLLLVLPPVAALVCWIGALRTWARDRAKSSLWALVALGLLWVPVAYFPHSNIPVILPTVRAERFWYLPVLGCSFVLAVLMAKWLQSGRLRRAAWITVSFLFAFQMLRARTHALDYSDDLTFWRATHYAVPNSAKAYLNYSVMVGAHKSDLPTRLVLNGRAIELAPKWPMAHVYYGDTLCRMKRPHDAFPHYERGFALAPNDSNLIALALQCLWDQKAVGEHQDELLAMAEEHPGTWLAYLATEIVHRGEEHGGVEKKYRPRGYDEGPKQ